MERDFNNQNTNRIAFISGGSRGIGAETVKAFALSGYTTVFCYKENKTAADLVACELATLGYKSVRGYKCDVSDYKQVQNLKKAINNDFGMVDTIVNNAGVCHYKMFTDETEDDFNFVNDNNFKSVFNVCSVFVPDMVLNKFGRIINISSIFGEVGGAMETLYSATKSAIIGFTKALSNELALSGITVNAIAPGLIDTDMNNNLSAMEKNSLVENIPVNRIGQPADIARVALFLAEKSSSFITAQTINVNGGEY